MAEKAAHLTGTAFKKPSIFEIVAQGSLASVLEPAFKKIFSFLISFNYERYGHLSQWSDEVYVILNTFLQWYYLNKYSASFSETFYGLKRISLENSKFKQSLSKRQRRLSLLLLVLLPCIKQKFAALSEKYKFEQTDGKGWEQFYRACITYAYTIILVLYDLVKLYNYMLYLSGKSPYPTAELKLLSTTLTYSDSHSFSGSNLSELLWKVRNNRLAFHDGLLVFEGVITRSIELGAFILQFLSWRSQENYYTNIMTLPVPAAPMTSKMAEQHKGKCPICCNAPHIHTALMVSGYVFCYQCILPVIQKHKKCPLTNLPATEDDLIRLYIE